MLTDDVMRQMWPQGNSRISGLTEAIAASAAAVFHEFGLNSNLVIAHAMAQFSHECAAGAVVVENLNYTAAELQKTWPTRFDAQKAAQCAGKPTLIADEVYNGRMGNRPGTDDGWNFRGRGGSQVTGRDGYQGLGARLGLDLVGQPDLVNDPAHFLRCAVATFVLCGCLPFAEEDDVAEVTRHLNGGLIGLSSREAWLERWKTALAQTAGDEDLCWAQQTLNDLGATPQLVCDGLYGPKTTQAIMSFQKKSNIVADGKLGVQTASALADALAAAQGALA